MNKTVVITGTGRDRVGIVAELSDFLYALGCNLLDSSMTLLRGEFALILMASLPENLSVEGLDKQLQDLQERLSLTFSVRELTSEELQEASVHNFQYMVSVYGADRPGIVAGITRALADMKLNVTDVQTKSIKQAQGEVFVMMLELSCLEELDAIKIQERLSDLCKSMSVHVSVQALEVLDL